MNWRFTLFCFLFLFHNAFWFCSEAFLDSGSYSSNFDTHLSVVSFANLVHIFSFFSQILSLFFTFLFFSFLIFLKFSPLYSSSSSSSNFVPLFSLSFCFLLLFFSLSLNALFFYFPFLTIFFFWFYFFHSRWFIYPSIFLFPCLIFTERKSILFFR